MSTLVKDVGAVAGIASFLGLALLALLYFTQARDVRRLREQASILVEGEDGEALAPAERPATAVATKEPEKAAAAAAATAPNEAEAFRRAELARQAAKRRQRFEQRRRRPDGGRERPAWLSEPLTLAAVVVGAIILVAGVAFGVTRLTGGGSDSSTAPQGQAKKGPCPARADQGRRAQRHGDARPRRLLGGPAEAGAVQGRPGGQHIDPFPVSVVMFDPTDGKECAPIVGQIVGVSKTQTMNNEVRQAAEGDPVAVVLGDDKAEASSGTGASDTTGSGI